MAGKTTYKPEYANVAKVATELGAIDDQLAEMLGVSRQTIFNWRKDHAYFAEACDGRKIANNEVKQALFKRATGCVTWKEALNRDGVPVTLKTQHPPDTGACMAWLYNRDRDNWKKEPADMDKKDAKDANTYNITIVKPSDAPSRTN